MVKEDSDRLSALRQQLRQSLGDNRYELWLGDQTGLELQGDKLRVDCASETQALWMRRKLHVALCECAARTFPRPTDVVYDAPPQPPKGAGAPASARPRASKFAKGQLSFVDVEAPPPSSPAVEPCAPPSPAPSPAPAPAVAMSSFGDFVVGASNRLAAQAAREAAQQPGRFTPLLIYGEPGSGKTHLLRAIARDGRASGARLRTLSLTAEQFTSQFLEALDKRAVPGFRQKMRTLELLIVDDVQFLASKKATLDELLYTIDALHARGAQVVLAADRAAAELQFANGDLASRISAGLSVAIEPADYETRCGILRAMAQRMRVPLDAGVVEHVAQQVVGSARLLSGAVNRLVAASMALERPITLELAAPAIVDFCRQHAPQVRLGDIQRAVCEVFGIESARLKSAQKTRAVAEPRALAMWLARRYTRAALSEIGEFFGRRSHSTVVSAQRKFDQLVSSRGEIVVGGQLCHVEDAIRRVEARLRSG